MNFYPLKLKPVTKSIIWGGDYLKNNFGYESDDDNIAEAWLTTCRSDGMSIIENGAFAGVTLDKYILENGKENVYGDFNSFPLLIKLIDANDRLSVQVHPDDDYAEKHGLDAGKTEMWYIVEAKEGSKLVYGLKDKTNLSAEELKHCISEGLLDAKLNYVNVKKGDCFYIPAGLVHAIGAGIVIAEIQQNSNTTYRLYDYDRIGKDGKKRELHTEKAAEVIKTDFDDNFVSGKKVSDTKTILCDCELFSVEKYMLNEETIELTNGSMKSIICLDGSGVISCNEEKYEIKKGNSYLIPVALKNVTVTGNKNLEIIVSAAKQK